MFNAEDILLTTKDNKFNPFTEEDNWRAFDTDYSHPYNTEAYYMRLMGFRDVDSFSSEELATELMVDLYELITRDGQRLENVPEELLPDKTQRAYVAKD